MPSVDCRVCGHTMHGDGEDPIAYADCHDGHIRAAHCALARRCSEIIVREGLKHGGIPTRGRELFMQPLDS